MTRIIKHRNSVIIACDVESIHILSELVNQTHDVSGIGAYKVGFSLIIRYGLSVVVQEIRKITDLPIIYDHQKAMTDIDSVGDSFAKAVKESGADALIGFPQAGPSTEEAWLEACKHYKLPAIIGGEMTHPKFKQSEGGFIADESLDLIYRLAAEKGVLDFVVPGNRIQRVEHYRDLLLPLVGSGVTFYAPGFITQGGEVTEMAKALNKYSWHAIIGRAIYDATDKKAAAVKLTSQLPM
jgi:orotidine-5'-phosphate decarboxylase